MSQVHPSISFSLRFILVFFHLRLGSTNCLSSLYFPTKILYESLPCAFIYLYFKNMSTNYETVHCGLIRKIYGTVYLENERVSKASNTPNSHLASARLGFRPTCRVA